eukprot:scaffold1293_cov262-Pinguiococcus_pyrenoidosus.AAC.3
MFGITRTVAIRSRAFALGSWGSARRRRKPSANHSAMDSPGCCLAPIQICSGPAPGAFSHSVIVGRGGGARRKTPALIHVLTCHEHVHGPSIQSGPDDLPRHIINMRSVVRKKVEAKKPCRLDWCGACLTSCCIAGDAASSAMTPMCLS